jgi:hypothetical protein
MVYSLHFFTQYLVNLPGSRLYKLKYRLDRLRLYHYTGIEQLNWIRMFDFIYIRGGYSSHIFCNLQAKFYL